MEEAKSLAWKVVAALVALFLVGTALLMAFARTTSAQENARAAQAAGVRASSTPAAKGAAGENGVEGASGPAAAPAGTEAGAASADTATSATSAQPATGQGQAQAGAEDGALAGTPAVSAGESATQGGAAEPEVHPAFDVNTGPELYAAACQSCHMPGGTGASGGAGTKNYPALAGNQNLQTAVYPATFILNGAGAMPSFAGQLTDEQIAALVNYLRQDLNKFEGETTAADIAPLRQGARSTKLGAGAG